MRATTPDALARVHNAYLAWLGKGYDLDVLDVVLAVAASEQLSGDPAWLLVVGGSGAAKTETLLPLGGAGAHVSSTISSEGALLSGTAQRERAKNATGGLLRKIGPTGLLVIKDVTSILSMNRDSRATVLAALREVYDGRWERNLGSDGGRTLTWVGRIVLIGAVTTSWDKAHSVIAAMGDRFLLVRLDTTTGRAEAGRQAMRNTGGEVQMRTELAGLVAAVLGTVEPGANPRLDDAEVDELLELADVVTLARTAVEHDYRGDVIDAHAPEMPTRYAKQLTQVVRGAVALGIDRSSAVRLAARVAADSMPPLRMLVLLDLLAHPGSSTHAVRTRLEKPRSTVDRELQALHILGLLSVQESQEPRGTVWRYRLRDPEHDAAIAALGSARYVSTGGYGKEKGSTVHVPSDVSGTGSADEDGTLGLGRLDGRCESCEAHVPTQGHRPTCRTHDATT